MELLKVNCQTAALTIDDSTKLYRYIKAERLKEMLENKRLCFVNIKKQADQHEREIPPDCFKKWDTGRAEFYQKIMQNKLDMVPAYVTCWTKSQDNYAFWKIYAKQEEEYAPCMIETTLGKLKKQFKDNKSVLFYQVEYIDPNKSGVVDISDMPLVIFDAECKPNAYIAVEKFKIFPYTFEDEIRGIVYSLEDKDVEKIPINPVELIESIMISPFSDEESVKKTTEMIKKYLPKVEIKDSIIDESTTKQ